MCTPITLHHNKHGYISWCKECNHINIAFGTIVFALSIQQFEQFIQLINMDVTQYNGKMCSKEKSLMYNTDSSHINMVLCYTELVLLAELLNKATMLFQAHQILTV
ncbi:MAG: DUF6686 family protein [Bacteroidota bacterium]